MDFLLVIRGLAAISVVVWHAVGFQNEFYPVFNTPGRTAVWLFFGMSGYVIAYGFVHKRYRFTFGDLKDFYINRFLRIYPLFLTLSILAWVTELVATGNNLLSIKDLPAQLMAFQFNQSYILNGVFWTLGIEIHFYLLAPLLVIPILKSADKRHSSVILLSIYFVLLFWIFFAVKYLGWSYDGRNVISNLPHFFIGMAACQFVSTLKPNKLRLIVSVTCASVLLGYANWLYNRNSGYYWAGEGVLIVDAIIFLLVLTHASFERGQFKSNPVYLIFAYLGTLSYGVYAWHAYLMKYIPHITDNVLVLISVSVFVAYLSYRFIESPALKLKRERNHSPIEPVIK
ncbi:MAG: acyltransferase [Methylotenera sp.]